MSDLIIDYITVKKSSATISVNGEIISGINLEALAKFNLKEGEISENEYYKFIIENNKQKAKNSLLRSISYSSNSEAELRRKLAVKKYPKYAIEYAISFAHKYDYINDERYAENFIESNLANKGKYRLQYELRLKGIDESIIEKRLSIVKDSIIQENAIKVANKYMKSREVSQNTLEKLFRHLISRGYDYEMVKSVVSDFEPK